MSRKRPASMKRRLTRQFKRGSRNTAGMPKQYIEASISLMKDGKSVESAALSSYAKCEELRQMAQGEGYSIRRNRGRVVCHKPGVDV